MQFAEVVVLCGDDLPVAYTGGRIERETVALPGPDVGDHRLRPFLARERSPGGDLRFAAAGPPRLVLHVHAPVDLVKGFAFAADLVPAGGGVAEEDLSIALALAP